MSKGGSKFKMNFKLKIRSGGLQRIYKNLKGRVTDFYAISLK